MREISTADRIGRIFVAFAMASSLLLVPEWAVSAYADESGVGGDQAVKSQRLEKEDSSDQSEPSADNSEKVDDATEEAVGQSGATSGVASTEAEDNAASDGGATPSADEGDEPESVTLDNQAAAPTVQAPRAQLVEKSEAAKTESKDADQPEEKAKQESNEPFKFSFKLLQNDQALKSPYTVHVGTKVQIESVVSGKDSSKVKFNYGWNYQDKWVSWDSTMKNGKSDPIADTTYAFTPKKAGSYTVFVDAFLPSGKKITKQLKLNVTESWKVDGISLSSTSVNAGSAVSVNVKTSGADASVARFNYGWSYNGSWADGKWNSVMLATGSSTSDLQWSFTPNWSGTYTVFVDTFRTDGSKTTKTYTVKVNEGWSFTGVSVSSKSVKLGDSITMKAALKGGNTKVARFNFVWNYEGEWGEWSSTVLEEGGYTRDNSWSFTPARAGKYILYIDAVRTDGSYTTKQITVNVTSNWSASGLTLTSNGKALSNGNVSLGSPLEVSVRMGQNSNLTGLRYNFVWQRGTSWSEWDSLANDGKLDSTGKHTYKFNKRGTYWVYVDVMGTDGTTKTLSAKVNVVLPYKASGVSLSGAKVNVNDTVTITPKISGDYSSTKFNFGYAYNNEWDDWTSTVKRTGKNTSDDSWSFKPNKYGVYLIFIDVVAPDGEVQTFKAQLTVNRGWNPGSFAINKSSPQKVGTTLNFTVSVSGSQAKYVKYNFVWMRDNWADWSSTLVDTGTRTDKTTYSFTPKHSGDYMFAVDFYDTRTGQQVTKYINIRINKTWSVSKLNLSYSSPLRPGASVSFTPVVTGDKSGLTYNYVWMRDNWAQWNSTSKSSGKYTTSSTAKMTIGSSGMYSFYVDVKDKNGEVETVQVTRVRGYSKADAISKIQSKLDSGSVASGTRYNNALLDAGGQLCGGKWTLWCATYIWWAFYTTGFSDLWGTSGMNVDPEYLAEEFASMGRWYGGTSGIQRGDIAFMYYTPWRGGQYITHAAYVVGTTSSTITVMEGNTLTRQKYATYSRWSSNFVGYGRPAY